MFIEVSVIYKAGNAELLDQVEKIKMIINTRYIQEVFYLDGGYLPARTEIRTRKFNVQIEEDYETIKRWLVK